MKVFISSIITDMQPYRDAVERARRPLGHDVIRAEDFGASPTSPQQTCLAGVRAADVVVLLLGARYGAPQASGFSPTHEEYREARERCPVLAFVQQGVEREASQDAFAREVRDWGSGQYTENFLSADDLRDTVIRRLHQLELSRAAGPVDEGEMLARANELVREIRGAPRTSLSLAVVGGPRQQVLRPAELESEELGRALMQEALFGAMPILDPADGTRAKFEGEALVIRQDRALILLDELGSLHIIQPALHDRDSGWAEIAAIIDEEVRDRIERGLRFAGLVLDKIDEPRRVSEVVPLVALVGAGYLAWRTRAEHQASPRSGQTGAGSDLEVVELSPARQNRAALTYDTARMAEDLTVRLRRKVRS